MDTKGVEIGSRVEHPDRGAGVVTFVGVDYLGVRFDDAGEALVRRDSFTVGNDGQRAQSDSGHGPAIVTDREWPASTFVATAPDADHFMGSHWAPFADDAAEIIKRLPEMFAAATVQEGYGSLIPADRQAPDDWIKGAALSWPPLPARALSIIVAAREQQAEIVSLFPFYGEGSEARLSLRVVHVWESGLEAQIEASWGDASITFFDTRFVVDRLHYAAGRDYDFILVGIAYSAAVAQKHEWQIEQNAEVVEWLNRHRGNDEEPRQRTMTVSMDGAAALLPVEGWDVDDYSFHSTVKSVHPFSDWLGQDGWRVRATVMRDGDRDLDLDIVITRRVWASSEPPRVGQDIEGRLWTQGHLWRPVNRR